MIETVEEFSGGGCDDVSGEGGDGYVGDYKEYYYDVRWLPTKFPTSPIALSSAGRVTA